MKLPCSQNSIILRVRCLYTLSLPDATSDQNEGLHAVQYLNISLVLKNVFQYEAMRMYIRGWLAEQGK